MIVLRMSVRGDEGANEFQDDPYNLLINRDGLLHSVSPQDTVLYILDKGNNTSDICES